MKLTFRTSKIKLSLPLLLLVISGCADSGKSGIKAGASYENLAGNERLVVRENNEIDLYLSSDDKAMLATYSILENGQLRVSIQALGVSALYQLTDKGITEVNGAGELGDTLFLSDFLTEARCDDLESKAIPYIKNLIAVESSKRNPSFRALNQQVRNSGKWPKFEGRISGAGQHFVSMVRRDGCPEFAFWDSNAADQVTIMSSNNAEAKWTDVNSELKIEAERLAAEQKTAELERVATLEREQKRLQALYEASSSAGKTLGTFTAKKNEGLRGYSDLIISLAEGGLPGLAWYGGNLRWPEGAGDRLYSYCHLGGEIENSEWSTRKLTYYSSNIAKRGNGWAKLTIIFGSSEEQQRFNDAYRAAWTKWEASYTELATKSVCPRPDTFQTGKRW